MKDPAILFYWNDWRGGTMTLSRFIKGCYMDVLDAQFNNGHLSLEEIRTVLAADFSKAWPTLQKKFKTDADGLFFNERLEAELRKRRAYSESRSNNRKKSRDTSHDISHDETPTEIHNQTHDISYAPDMVNVNESVNENKNENGIENKEGSVGETMPTPLEEWTDAVLRGNDHHFEVQFQKKFPGRTVPADAVTGHQAMCLRNKITFDSQAHFRNSMLQYITTYLQNPKNHANTKGGVHQRKYGRNSESAVSEYFNTSPEKP